MSKPASPPSPAHSSPSGFQDPHDIVMNAPVGIFSSTPEGRYISANMAQAKMLGYDSPQELIEKVTDIASQVYCDPADREKFKKHLERQGEVVNQESRFRRRDGSVLWVSWSARAIRDSSGKTLYYQGFNLDITRNREMGKALQQSEQYYRAVFETSGAAQVIINEDTTIMRSNSRFQELSGYTGQDIDGKKSWTEFVDWQDLKRMKDYHYQRRHDQEKAPKLYEFRFVDRHGRKYNVLLNVDMIPGTTQSVASFIDLSARMEAEKSVREANQRLLAILNNINSLIYVADMDSHEVLFVNQYGRDNLGDIEGRKCWESIQSNQAGPCEFCTNSKLLDFQGKPRGVYRWEFKNTVNNKWFDCHDMAIRWTDGRMVRLEIAVDITGRKETEEKLRRHEGFLQAVFDSIQDGISVLDTELNIIRVNRVMKKWYSSMLPLEGKKCHVAYHGSSKKCGLCPSSRALKTGRLEFDEVPLVQKGIQTGVLELFAFPLVDQAGVCTGVVEYVRDITRRKQAEEEKEKLSAQLNQAQKMESVGMLAGGIAHDFNNLLHAMGGNLQLLEMNKPEGHPDKERLQTIQRSIDRASQLVRQLLLFSRKVEIRRKPLDLNQEIKETVKVLERSIPKMINIDLLLSPDLWTINADPVQVEQVLLNLGTNAADAMPEGGKMEIETRNLNLDNQLAPGLEPGPYVLMIFSDTGTGMDQKSLEQVFDPFFTTKEVGKGTGLGLASVYGAVKAHYGHIICRSEPGQGTSFSIYWPAFPEKVNQAWASDADACGKGGLETIMVVDDDLDIRELTAEALQSFGYNILMACSGEEALELFKEQGNRIELIVLDINMPGMGGHKCLARLLEIDPGVRVLISSGYSARDQAKGLEKSGASGFIGKPYQIKDLLIKIRDILDSGASYPAEGA